MPQPTAVIGQSGGPTAVINQSLVGAVEGLRQAGFDGRILGARHAVSGIVDNNYIDLTQLDGAKLDAIAGTPSSALGSSRDKPDETYCQRIIDNFREQDVRYFFYIGGNDSSDTCRIVAEKAADAGHELNAYHIPKTIDNDLVKNDHTPGYGSAAKFVAQAFMGDNLDNRALPGIKINIVMGRHAGFLTAASILGRSEETGGGPHLVYVPEVAFDEEKFISDVERIYTKEGRCLIAVSEGIHDASGNTMVTKLQEEVEHDAHGNVQLSGTGALGDLLSDLVKNKLGDRLNQKLRVRADTFGYLQRCFAGVVSEVDQREARAAGRKAAALAMDANEPNTGSVAITRVADDPYQVAFDRIEISDVAAKTRTLDPKYIKDGCDIDDSFKRYLHPIVGPLPRIAALP